MSIKEACFWLISSKKKIICDFYISYFDTYINDLKRFPRQSKKARKLLKIDYNCISKSNLTLFLTGTEAIRYLDLVNIPFDKEKHKIFPLVIEEQLKCELPYYRKHNTNSLNICWWGTYLPLHGLENLIKACSILKKNNVQFHLHLFGNSEKASVPYRKIVEDLNLLDYISFRNDMTFRNGMLGEFLKKNCDLVLGNFGESIKAKNVLPNKVLDGVAMKAPVLTGESIAAREFFSSQDIFYSSNDPIAIAEEIIKIYEFPEDDIKNMINRAYNVFNENFSIQIFRKRMELILNNL